MQYKSCLLFMLLSSASAYSNETEVQNMGEAKTPFYPAYYFGVNLGSADVSASSGAQSFSHTNLGLTFGYQFSPYMNAELYMSFALQDKKDNYTSYILDETVKVNHSVAGAYLVGKTKGKAYAKARFGLARSEFTYTAEGYEDESKAKMGLSYGIGAGIEHNDKLFEVDYIVFPATKDPLFSSVDYDISILSFGISWLY